MSGLTVNEGREAMDCSHKFAGLRIRTVLFKGSLEPTTDFQCKAVTRGSADLCQLAAEVVRQADF